METCHWRKDNVKLILLLKCKKVSQCVLKILLILNTFYLGCVEVGNLLISNWYFSKIIMLFFVCCCILGSARRSIGYPVFAGLAMVVQWILVENILYQTGGLEDNSNSSSSAFIEASQYSSSSNNNNSLSIKNHIYFISTTFIYLGLVKLFGFFQRLQFVYYLILSCQHLEKLQHPKVEKIVL